MNVRKLLKNHKIAENLQNYIKRQQRRAAAQSAPCGTTLQIAFATYSSSKNKKTFFSFKKKTEEEEEEAEETIA